MKADGQPASGLDSRGGRVSGCIAVPIAVHTLYDFAIFSATAGTSGATDTGTTFYLVVLTAGLLVLIAVFRRSLSPAGPVAEG